MNKVVSEKKFEINYYEVDFKKQLLITSLMNYFDDVATKQSEDIGGGLDYMRNKGIAWVLYKWDITVKRYPMFREKIKVRTSSYSLKKFYGYRTFEVFDKNNDVICTVNSVWLLIDINKRRAKRITEDIYKMYGLTEKDNKPLIIENVHLPERFDFERNFDVRYSDIDTNNHVNNVKYVDWAIETIPIDIVSNYSLENLNITYKKEAVYGENVKSSTKVQKTDCGYIGLHKISDSSDKELCVLKTVWKNKKKC